MQSHLFIYRNICQFWPTGLTLYLCYFLTYMKILSPLSWHVQNVSPKHSFGTCQISVTISHFSNRAWVNIMVSGLCDVFNVDPLTPWWIWESLLMTCSFCAPGTSRRTLEPEIEPQIYKYKPFFLAFVK